MNHIDVAGGCQTGRGELCGDRGFPPHIEQNVLSVPPWNARIAPNAGPDCIDRIEPLLIEQIGPIALPTLILMPSPTLIKDRSREQYDITQLAQLCDQTWKEPDQNADLLQSAVRDPAA